MLSTTEGAAPAAEETEETEESSFLRPPLPPRLPDGGVSHTETEWRRRRLRRLVVGVLAYLARSAATEMEDMADFGRAERERDFCQSDGANSNYPAAR